MSRTGAHVIATADERADADDLDLRHARYVAGEVAKTLKAIRERLAYINLSLTPAYLAMTFRDEVGPMLAAIDDECLRPLESL